MKGGENPRPYASYDLLCSENPVPCVAQAGNDVAILIQVVIQSGTVDLHIRVPVVDELHTLGRRHQDHQLDVFAALQ